MRIGIGIPNSIPGGDGRLLLDWAVRADRLGFSTLATIGRVAYPSYDELIVLSAAAGATERIGLFTDVLLGPTRNPVLLAREAAALDQLSGGRFVLGVAVGARADDFEVSGTTMRDRGRRWDRALEVMHAAWRGEPVAGSQRPVTVRPVNGERVPVMIGGTSDQALLRTVRWGIGWTAGGGGADIFAAMKARVEEAWAEASRDGRPEFRALSYFALGERTESGRDYLIDYYGSFAERIWPSVPRDRDTVAEVAGRFREAGADELIFSPTVASMEQVALLAEAVLE